MIRLLTLFCVFVLVLGGHVFSQNPQNLTPWQQQSPLPQSNKDSSFSYRGVALRALFFTSPVRGCAVGERGNIITTDDGGATWQPAQSNAFVDFSDVFFANPQRGWALSSRGRGGVYATQDGGRTWTLQSNQVFASSVSFLDSLNGAGAGGSGIIYRTLNGGQTWTQQRLPSPNTVNDVQFVTPQNGFAAARDGIFSTNDSGQTWTKASVPVDKSFGFRDIHFINPQTGWATGENNTLLFTANGGQTWTAQRVPAADTTDDLTTVRFVNANVGWVSSGNTKLYRTTDGGRSWALSIDFPVPPNGFLANFTFFDARIGWAITTRIFPSATINGEHHVIWRTSDGGVSWQQVSTSRVSILTDMAVTGKQTVLAVGNYLMNHTTNSGALNSGALWTIDAVVRDTLVQEGQFYRAVSAVNERTAFSAGWYSRIARTDDGGNTWRPLSFTESTRNDSLLGIHFVDSLNGWVVGIRHGYSRAPAGNRIYRTTNGGRSWVLQTPSRGLADAPDVVLNDVQFVSQNVGWVVGSEGSIYATRNGGTTWTRQTTSTKYNLFKMTFLNENVGYVCGGNLEAGIILKTTDGGTTWRRQLVPADGALRGIAFVDEQNGWTVGNGGLILATRNGGQTWEQQLSSTTSDLYAIDFASPVRGWIVGDDGTILATQNGGFTPRASTSASGLDFGSVAVSDNAARTVTVSAENMLAPLILTAPAGFTIEFGGQRGQTLFLPPTELATTQANITLRFTPTRDGAVSSILKIESPFITSTVALIGVGVQRPVLRFSPEQGRLNFASTNVGSQTQATVTITNTGVAGGTISFAITPQDTSRRAVFDGLPQTFAPIQIAPNQSLPLELRFTPRSFGLQQATLEVMVKSATFDTTYRVQLQGIGLQAALQAQPQTLDMGMVSLNQTTSGNVGFINNGNIAANLRRVVIDPPDNFRLASPFAPRTLAPQDVFSLGILFTPSTLGFARATLLLISDTDTLRTTLIGGGIPLLDKPTPSSPFNGRINTPVSTVFTWQQPAPMLVYDVQVARDSNFTTIVAEQTNLRSLSFTPTTDLQNSTRYYWRVRARNMIAVSEWSQTYTFETIRTNPYMTSSPELVQISGIVGQTQRGYFTVRSSVKDTILQADFRLLNDDNSYSVRQDQFPLILRANLTETITFDFSPKQESKTIRGTLRLTGRRDTLLVPFSCEGIARDSTMIFTKVAVQTDRTNVTAGDSVTIRLVMTESQNLDVGRNRGRAQSFNALLRIRNESVLAPFGTLSYPSDLSNNVLLGNGGKTVELRNIPRQNSMKTGTLAELPASVLLGNATSTAIEFLSFEWNDPQDQQRSIQSVLDSSVAMVVCTAGGTPRLIERRQPAQLQALAPNPASDKLTVTYSLLEDGSTALYLVDVLGNRVRTFFAGKQTWGEFSQTLDVTGLADGVYMLILQTPSQILQQRIGILK